MPSLVLPRTATIARAGLPGRRTYAWNHPVLVGGCQLWFAADHISLLPGSAVPVWPDFSGHNRHATQSDAAKQPTVRGPLNGHRVVRFDGTDDYLDTDASPAFDGDLMTWFALFDTDAPGTAQVVIRSAYTSGAGAQSGALCGVYMGSNLLAVHARNSDGTIKQVTAALAASTYTLASGVWDASNQVWGWKDGASMATPASLATAAPTGHLRTRLGANSVATPDTFLAGSIVEVIQYNRVLSDRERISVQEYLAEKYARGVKLA